MQSLVHICPRMAMIGTGVFLVLTHASATSAEKTPSNRPVLKTQIGDATYYAARFQGRTTASGRIFDKNKAMAAHRTYPFGTVVRVTNLRNKRSVNVVIVDRGPYGKNRREGAIIDVSPSVAEKLGILRTGQTRVKLEVLIWGDGERFNQKSKIIAS